MSALSSPRHLPWAINWHRDFRFEVRLADTLDPESLAPDAPRFPSKEQALNAAIIELEAVKDRLDEALYVAKKRQRNQDRRLAMREAQA